MRQFLRSKMLKALFGIAISAVLLVWLYYSVSWDEVWVQLLKTHYWVFIPATPLLIVQYVLRAQRWKYLLPPQKDGESDNVVPLRGYFDSIMVGVFATFILPLRAGEFVRPYMLSRISRYSFSTSFVSVVIERFFDLIIVLLSFGLMAFFIPDIPPWGYRGAMLLSTLAVAIIVFMIFAIVAPQWLEQVVDFCLRFVPSFIRAGTKKFLFDFIEGASVSLRRGNLSRVIFLTIVVWTTSYALFYSFLFLFDMPRTFWMAISVSVVIALAVAAPSAPGFIGVYQVACIAGFALFGIPREIAVAYSIVTHAYQFIIFIIYGVFVLFKYNLKLAEMQGEEDI